eukprot:TRINITY_DN4431_c0_g1_i5.p1 TRINITY_DN4431_c0_g1~~TRINITY_DN4431_c0_g1_i5.p1  ORF type:complete len:210 (+),score=48.94 TRINITY_DN4431_c0_g1_i5:117-746(+)
MEDLSSLLFRTRELLGADGLLTVIFETKGKELKISVRDVKITHDKDKEQVMNKSFSQVDDVEEEIVLKVEEVKPPKKKAPVMMDESEEDEPCLTVKRRKVMTTIPAKQVDSEDSDEESASDLCEAHGSKKRKRKAAVVPRKAPTKYRTSAEAAAERLIKKDHPELYCDNKKCLRLLTDKDLKNRCSSCSRKPNSDKKKAKSAVTTGRRK